jgi:hypothetical protein
MKQEELQKDVDFLVNRSMKAGECSFSNEREVGISSNSIVAIAYGVTPLSSQRLPSDTSDLRACENMWAKLPEHRKTAEATMAIQIARQYINDKYPSKA